MCKSMERPLITQWIKRVEAMYAVWCSPVLLERPLITQRMTPWEKGCCSDVTLTAHNSVGDTTIRNFAYNCDSVPRIVAVVMLVPFHGDMVQSEAVQRLQILILRWLKGGHRWCKSGSSKVGIEIPQSATLRIIVIVVPRLPAVVRLVHSARIQTTVLPWL